MAGNRGDESLRPRSGAVSRPCVRILCSTQASSGIRAQSPESEAPSPGRDGATLCRVTGDVPLHRDRDEYAELVREAASGDDAAMARLLIRAQQLAHRFSLAVCGHANDVDDAMQEALVKTYRYASRIEQPETFRTWLYRTVKNACLIHRRRRSHEPPHFEPLENLAVPATSPTPEDTALSASAARQLRQALGHLPPSAREVIFLREVEGLSTREASAVLGTSEDNVKTRLSRARRQLRRELAAIRPVGPSSKEADRPR
jgi:RNA polymerase sigma-70 factor (ECF subfamily)